MHSDQTAEQTLGKFRSAQTADDDANAVNARLNKMFDRLGPIMVPSR